MVASGLGVFRVVFRDSFAERSLRKTPKSLRLVVVRRLEPPENSWLNGIIEKQNWCEFGFTQTTKQTNKQKRCFGQSPVETPPERDSKFMQIGWFLSCRANEFTQYIQSANELIWRLEEWCAQNGRFCHIVRHIVCHIVRLVFALCRQTRNRHKHPLAVALLLTFHLISHIF